MRCLISLLLVALSFVSCKESKQDRVNRLIKEWHGKTINFPDSMCLTSYRNDTVITKYTRASSSYTILNYVDTIGCFSCRLQLPRWKEMIESLDSIYPNRVQCLMVFYPKGERKLAKHLRINKFENFVFVDKMDTLNRMNHFLNEEHFCTFLLNEDDEIVAIGNPVLNPNIEELYWKIIAGENSELPTHKELKTDIAFDKTNAMMGNFDWKNEQTERFELTNIGGNLLVITGITTSCGCTTVEYSKEPLPSGKTLTLRVKYKADHPEHFNKTITVYCNAKGSPFQLKISGNAK